MNVLSIGNSFSQDATRYLHQIARADGVLLNCTNLHIGGCSLWRHYINALNDAREYELDYNGMETKFKVSIKEALTNREWDIVTIQQVSNESVDYEKFQPYLDFMNEYIKKYSPKSKIYIHQTWQYSKEDERLTRDFGFDEPQQMYEALKSAYAMAAETIMAYDIIPSGEIINKIANSGIKIHRDTAHVTFGLGRYALGLLWYSKLTKKTIENNSFSDFDEEIRSEDIKFVKKCVAEILKLQ